MVVFDTEVVDLTDEMEDPCGPALRSPARGGTDIDRALHYRMERITRPEDTTL